MQGDVRWHGAYVDDINSRQQRLRGVDMRQGHPGSVGQHRGRGVSEFRETNACDWQFIPYMDRLSLGGFSHIDACNFRRQTGRGERNDDVFKSKQHT